MLPVILVFVHHPKSVLTITHLCTSFVQMAAPALLVFDEDGRAEASPHKRRLKCDTKHQSQEADVTFITSDGSKPCKPWRTLDTDTDNDNN